MKIVYKKIVVAITALFVVSLSFLPFAKSVKAADDNETSFGPEYNFILVTLPVQYSFTAMGSYSPKYVTGPLRFSIYNTVTFSTGSVFTVDYLYTFGNTNGGIISYLLSQSTVKPYYWYIAANGTTMSGSGLAQGMTLNVLREVSETITGTLKAFTTGLYANTQGQDVGFYVTFNFETGYKKYTFYADNVSEVKAYGHTVPLTTTIGTISADTIGSYNEGKNIGYTTGYNEGFDAGKSVGDKTGYNRGYNEGYTAGRDAPDYSFSEFFIGLGDAFVTIYTSMLSYEFLGINLAGLIGTIVVIVTILIVVKVVLRK